MSVRIVATMTVAAMLPLHYFAGIDWPQSAAIGVVAAVVLRFVASPVPSAIQERHAQRRGRRS